MVILTGPRRGLIKPPGLRVPPPSTIGARDALGSKRFGGSTVKSVPISTTAAVAAHEQIIVGVEMTSGGGAHTGCTDSAGNVYQSLATLSFGSAGQFRLWYCLDALPMPSESVITPAWTNDAKGCAVAFKTSGLATAGTPTPYGPVTNSGAASITLGTSGANLPQASMLLISVVSTWDRASPVGNPGAWTPGAGFAFCVFSGDDSENEIHMDTAVSTTTAPVSITPAWTNSASMVAGGALIAFPGA